MLLRRTEKIDIFCSFQIFDIFLSTNFAQNMNSALPSNRIFTTSLVFEKTYMCC